MPSEDFVELKVYNIIGKELTVLLNQTMSAGIHKVNFDGDNFPNGIYFCKLSVGGFTETRKMILLK